MSRRLLLLVLAGGIILFTIMLMRSRLTETPVVATGSTAAPSARVLIAKRDLMVGSFVQGGQDLDWGQAPDASGADASGTASSADAASHESYLYEGSVKINDFNGAIVRRTLHAGDAVPQNALMKSGEGGFMSAVLNPGMRAVSIAVNATSGNAGFVSPGDRIDMIVTHRVKPQTNSSQEFVVSETFVRNVRVVAVDQMLDNPENKAILAKTLTVEVTPRQAEEVSVAADLGKISIALRSLTSPETATNENSKAAPESAVQAVNKVNDTRHADSGDDSLGTRDSDISAMMQAHSAEVSPHVQVIHGDKVETMDFNQGQR